MRWRRIYEEDFVTAKIIDDEIVLYDNDLSQIRSISFRANLSKEILYISNEETNIRFWYKGFDDMEGIMIMKGDFDRNSFDGLAHIRKLQGNVYVIYTQTWISEKVLFMKGWYLMRRLLAALLDVLIGFVFSFCIIFIIFMFVYRFRSTGFLQWLTWSAKR